MTQKPLMKYHCELETESGEIVKTWGVYPILNTTKILDGLFDPKSGALRLKFDSAIENIAPDYEQDPNTKKYKVVNRRRQYYHSGTIMAEDLEFFLNTYVENNFDYKFEKQSLILNEFNK